MVYDQIDMKRERSEGFGDGLGVGVAIGILIALGIIWLIHLI